MGSADRAKKRLFAVQLRTRRAARPACGDGNAAIIEPFKPWRMSKSDDPRLKGDEEITVVAEYGQSVEMLSNEWPQV